MRSAPRPGDVYLVEGNRRISAIIKFLTQSTWSYAALHVGERPGDLGPGGEPKVLLEAEAGSGVVTVPLSKYAPIHTRICRPVGLDVVEDRQKVIDYALARPSRSFQGCFTRTTLQILQKQTSRPLLAATSPIG